jgi:uncharacterized membrane protein (DUF2068 family)
MIALAFFASIALLFAALLAYETLRSAQPLGLWRWLTHGNWSVQFGAARPIRGDAFALLRVRTDLACRSLLPLVVAAVKRAIFEINRRAARRRSSCGSP